MAGKRVFAVLDEKGVAIGVAFGVAAEPPIVVTCTHTVARARNEKTQPLAGDAVSIRVGGDSVQAHVVRNSVSGTAKGDVPRTALSILRLEGALDIADVHVLADLVDPRGVRYSTYGFPAAFAERGVGSSGTLADVTQDGDALVTMRGETEPAVAPGFSGAPVRLDSGEVVGVVAAAARKPSWRSLMRSRRERSRLSWTICCSTGRSGSFGDTRNG